MNDILAPTPLSMSSKEIAELTGKRHDNVLRDIKAMLAQIHDSQCASDLSYQGIQGVTVEVDAQTKRTACIHLAHTGAHA